MKPLIFSSLLLVASLDFAQATTISAPSGMIGTGALNGNYAYLWAVPVTAQNINSASITFTSIKETAGGNGNSISVDFGTFVNIGIGTVPSAGNFKTKTDNDVAGDYFAGLVNSGNAMHLGTELFPSLNVSHTWTYVFTAAQLVALNAYIAFGNWGFEIDPDCHFNVGNIQFNYTTQPVTNNTSVPDSGATVGLLGMTMLGLVALRRKYCMN